MTTTRWSIVDGVRCDHPARPEWTPFETWDWTFQPGGENGGTVDVTLPSGARLGQASASANNVLGGTWSVQVARADGTIVHGAGREGDIIVGDDSGSTGGGKWPVRDANHTITWKIEGYVEQVHLSIETLACKTPAPEA